MAAVMRPNRAFKDNAYKIDKTKLDDVNNESCVEENRENERIFNMTQTIKKSGDAKKQLEEEKPIVINEKTCDKQNNLGKPLQNYDATKNLDVKNDLDITAKMENLKLQPQNNLNNDEESNLESVVKDMNELNISNHKEDIDKSKEKKVKKDRKRGEEVKKDRKEKRGNKENTDSKNQVDDNNKKKGKSKDKKEELSQEDEEKLKRRKERKLLKEKEEEEKKLREARIRENDKHMVSRGPSKKLEPPTKLPLSQGQGRTSGGRIIRVQPDNGSFNPSGAQLEVLAQYIRDELLEEFIRYLSSLEIQETSPQPIMETPLQGYNNIETIPQPVMNAAPDSPQSYTNLEPAVQSSTYYQTVPNIQLSPSTSSAQNRRDSDADSGLGYSPQSIRSPFSPDGIYRNLSSPSNRQHVYHPVPEEIPTTVAAISQTPTLSVQDRMKQKLDKRVKAFVSAELFFKDELLKGVDRNGNTILMRLFQLRQSVPNFLEICYCFGERVLALDMRAEQNEALRLLQVNQRGQNLLDVIRESRVVEDKEIILEYFADLCQNRLYN